MIGVFFNLILTDGSSDSGSDESENDEIDIDESHVSKRLSMDSNCSSRNSINSIADGTLIINKEESKEDLCSLCDIRSCRSGLDIKDMPHSHFKVEELPSKKVSFAFVPNKSQGSSLNNSLYRQEVKSLIDAEITELKNTSDKPGVAASVFNRSQVLETSSSKKKRAFCEIEGGQEEGHDGAKPMARSETNSVVNKRKKRQEFDIGRDMTKKVENKKVAFKIAQPRKSELFNLSKIRHHDASGRLRKGRTYFTLNDMQTTLMFQEKILE
jgi:hypothetical protein